MNNIRLFRFVACALFSAIAGCQATRHSPQMPQTVQSPSVVKVLLVVGNHKMDAPHFFRMFDGFPEIHYTVCYEGGTVNVLDRTDLARFDTVLLYDSQQSLTEAQKQRFLSLFDHGTGLVVLNHSLLNYQHWPEFERIVGGKYLLDTEHLADGTVRGESHNKLDTDIPLTIVDRGHPITAGLQDFTLHDELYRSVPVTADVHVLMTTVGTAGTVQPQAWTRQEKNSRVATIVFGDGPAYTDPHFQQLLTQALRWAGRGL